MRTNDLKKKTSPSTSARAPLPTVASLDRHSARHAQIHVRQAGFHVDAPNAIFEHETEGIAEQVIQVPGPNVDRQTEPEKEKETVQSKPFDNQIASTIQKQVNEEEEEKPIQTKMADCDSLYNQDGKPNTILEPYFGHNFNPKRVYTDGETIHELAERGFRSDEGSIPYIAEIQRMFGRHDIRRIRAHQGSRAAAAARAIGARAYATGGHIVFSEAPDLNTAAHEAAHVVQQRAGLKLPGDIGQPGDVYERHADMVADRVISGRSAETLLDQMAPAGSRALELQRQVVQRSPVPTDYGEFDTIKYNKVGPAGNEDGVDIELAFDPDRNKVDAKKIGLTQAVRTYLGGVAVAIEPSRRKRIVPSGVGEGYEIDNLGVGPYGNPLYVAGIPRAKDKLGDTPVLTNRGKYDWGKHGCNYKDSKGKLHHEKASLKDTPSQPGRGKNSGQSFETTALAVEGTQAGTYMGSVTWGWNVDSAGKFSQLPLTIKSKGNPSNIFFEAAKQWNKWFTSGTIKTNLEPTNVYDTSFSVAFTVAKNTEVTVVAGDYIKNNVPYNDVTVNSGPQKGKTGRIKVADMTDVGGGNPTIKLPIP